MQFTIRKFTVKDLFTVIGMLKEVAKSSTELTKLISSRKKSNDDETEAPEGASAEIGIRVLIACYEAVYDPCIEWFASLIEKTVEEFLSLPAESALQIIEQIVEAEDAKNFFTSAWNLFKKTNALKNALSSVSRQ